MFKKASWTLCVLAACISFTGCSKEGTQGENTVENQQEQLPQTIRIGFQKSSTLFTLLKQSGELEQLFQQKGVTVSWHEFSSGLPLLEALNTGNIDVSADVADTVPVFIQATDAKITYYAKETPSPKAQAILIPKHSSIQKISELKGKKIAVTKAAGSHYLLIAALNQAGLTLKDVYPAWLSPADGRAAFEQGSVDAWVTWEPYVSSGQIQQDAKILITGENLANYNRYYLSSNQFSKQYPQVMSIIFHTVEEKGKWVKSNPDAAAKVLAPLWGKLPLDVVKQANDRRSYNVQYVNYNDMDEQQKIADAFYKEGLIPKKINARNVIVFTGK
nr:aliphatic sulfonate ABC transporter substrate-binding protein [Acinetobacter sp. Marseille-Q1620]